tara:strand:+ start:400 stop:828 length:429 start_codon:yes stop_codon:yes gene_type:complete
MDQYVEIKIKNFAKYNKKIICFSSKGKEIPNNEELSEKVVQKYKELLIKNPGCVSFIDLRIVEKFPITLAWNKVNSFATEIDPVARKNLFASVIFVSGQSMKTFVNSIFQVYPPTVPTKICNSNEEAMEFVVQIINKRAKKE